MKTFYPTTEEFKEPLVYIENLYKRGASRYGCIKIIPPKEFKTPFAFSCESN
jgi:hypothetical protein